jgi:hypothetical protein
MPSYAQLLEDSMLFTAARGHGMVEPVEISGSFTAPKPAPLKEFKDSVDILLKNPIWHFEYDPGKPATFRNLTVKSRGMGMNYSMAASAYEKVMFKDARIVRADGAKVDLPLTPAYVVGNWWLRTGKIPESGSGLWQLEALTDTSVLVAFAYQLVCGEVVPLPLEEIETLGEAFMPDQTPEAFRMIVRRQAEALVCIGPARYLVLAELVLCKERPDFVPGGLIGMARIHPHAMLISNEDLLSFECTVDMARKPHAMNHGDPEMDKVHKALVVCDTNTPNTPLPVPNHLPFPYTDIIYDYYETDPVTAFKNRDPAPRFDEPDANFPDYPGDHPRQRAGEVTLADKRFPATRWIPKAVRRTSLKLLPTGPAYEPIVKFPRQGQFDNVHIAPRMRAIFEGADGPVTLDEIVMLFVCLHDCVHMHVRWGGFAGNDTEKIIRGWKNGLPFQEAGVPAVPENQTVFASFPNQHSLRYRALAENVPAGRWQVVNHHGSAYAVDVWPEAEITTFGMRKLIESYAQSFDEPYVKEMLGGWPAFYWRIRWGGKYGEPPVQRLSFDLQRCMR